MIDSPAHDQRLLFHETLLARGNLLYQLQRGIDIYNSMNAVSEVCLVSNETAELADLLKRS